MDYQDLGMMKWQGMILSEHTEQLEQAKKKIAWLPRLPEECLVNLLSTAITKQRRWLSSRETLK